MNERRFMRRAIISIFVSVCFTSQPVGLLFYLVVKEFNFDYESLCGLTHTLVLRFLCQISECSASVLMQGGGGG
jgi:hypothetical protein